MDDKEIHQLAVAYAQAKLLVSHLKEKDSNNECDSEEIYQFLKMYRFALENIPEEWKKID